MKKILTLCMAVIAAMSMSAEIKNMTCAEAANAAALLQSGQTGTDSVAVTGYVTNTDGKISKGQQTFWLDDEKGSKRTFQGYWCNMPDGESPLNIGDKVVIKGLLMNFKNTAEMKNGDVTILERAIVKIDTIKATVCDAIEEGEALADGDNTQDVFVVEGVVSSIPENNDTYKTQKFNVTCEENEKNLQAYNVTMKDGYAALGDKVRLTGKLKKIGTTIELVGDGLVLEKGNVQIDTVEVNVAEALAAVKALENSADSDRAVAAKQLGEIMFTCASLARKLDLDAEEVLTDTNNNYIEKFEKTENAVRQNGQDMTALSIDELDAYWREQNE